MPKWLVKLKGEEFDLEAIARLLRSPSLNVTKEEDGYYLRSAAFDHLTDPSEIGEQAALILRRASAVERIRCGSSLPLERDVVYQVQADGSRRDFLDVELQFSWDVRAPHVPATSDEVSRFSATVNRAETDPKIDKALRLLITRETTWSTTLYNILEVVLEDVGGTVWRSGWASESEVRRFKQTSKSPAVLGDEARHGRERTDPPKDPMTLADADTLVRQILREWLRLKVSGLSDDRSWHTRSMLRRRGADRPSLQRRSMPWPKRSPATPRQGQARPRHPRSLLAPNLLLTSGRSCSRPWSMPLHAPVRSARPSA